MYDVICYQTCVKVPLCEIFTSHLACIYCIYSLMFCSNHHGFHTKMCIMLIYKYIAFELHTAFRRVYIYFILQVRLEINYSKDFKKQITRRCHVHWHAINQRLYILKIKMMWWMFSTFKHFVIIHFSHTSNMPVLRTTMSRHLKNEKRLCLHAFCQQKNPISIMSTSGGLFQTAHGDMFFFNIKRNNPCSTYPHCDILT